MAKIIDVEHGKIALVTPWNAQIIAEAKARMGSWQRVKVSSGELTAWVIDSAHRSYFEELIAEVFPPAHALIERVVEFEVTGYSPESPKIDGYDLFGFNRDRVWAKKFDGGEPVKVLQIMENSLEAGGSRNNPRLYGRVVVRVRCRPQAVAEWVGGSVEVIS